MTSTDDMQDVLAGRARWAVLCADAADALKEIPTASVDALIGDPPSGTAFMQSHWDRDKGGRDQWIAWLAGIMAEARRVIKPGGYALVWALPRTSHWTAMALEDSGWTIRDSIAHLFGSGFPKSQSCLKPAHEVWWLAKAPGPLQPLQIDACRLPTVDGLGRSQGTHNAFPFSDDSWGNGHLTHTEGHSGGRWPPNTLLSHVGGPHGCVPAGVRSVQGNGHYPATRGKGGLGTAGHSGQQRLQEGHMAAETIQQWDCHPTCPIRILDEQAGPRTSGGYPPAGGRRSHGATYGRPNERGEPQFGASAGSVSRFFPTFAGALESGDAVPFRYVSKASRRERNGGCQRPTAKACGLVSGATPVGASETFSRLTRLARALPTRGCGIGRLSRVASRYASRAVQGELFPASLSGLDPPVTRSDRAFDEQTDAATTVVHTLAHASCLGPGLLRAIVARAGLVGQALWAKTAKALALPPRPKGSGLPRLKARHREAHRAHGLALQACDSGARSCA